MSKRSVITFSPLPLEINFKKREVEQGWIWSTKLSEVAMKWKEVEAQALELGKHYITEFHNRFKVQPPDKFETTDLEILRWIINSFGLEVSKKLVTTFIGIDDDWISRVGHSLPQFKKSVVRVMEEEGKKHPKAYAQVTNRLHGLLGCDSCWVSFEAIYPRDVDWSNTWIRCTKCLLENKPWKYPTLQEWVVKFGGKFSEKRYKEIFKTKEPYPDKVHLDYEVPDQTQFKRVAIQTENPLTHGVNP